MTNIWNRLMKKRRMTKRTKKKKRRRRRRRRRRKKKGRKIRQSNRAQTSILRSFSLVILLRAAARPCSNHRCEGGRSFLHPGNAIQSAAFPQELRQRPSFLFGSWAIACPPSCRTAETVPASTLLLLLLLLLPLDQFPANFPRCLRSTGLAALVGSRVGRTGSDRCL